MTSTFDSRIRPQIQEIFNQLVEIETELQKLNPELLKESLYVQQFHETIFDWFKEWLDDDTKITSDPLVSWLSDLPGRTSILIAPFLVRIEVDNELKQQIENNIDSKISDLKTNVRQLVATLQEIQAPTGEARRILTEMKEKLEKIEDKTRFLPYKIKSGKSALLSGALSQLETIKLFLIGKSVLDSQYFDTLLNWRIKQFPNSVFEKKVYTPDGFKFVRFEVKNQRDKDILDDLEEENIRQFLFEKWTELRKVYDAPPDNNNESVVAASLLLCSNENCEKNAKYRAKGYGNLFYCSHKCLEKHWK